MSTENPSQTPSLDGAIKAARQRVFAATDSQDAVESVVAEIELKLLDRKRDCARCAVRMADVFLKIAELVDTDPQNHNSVDAFGEALRSTVAIDGDRGCAEVRALRQVLADITTARKGADR